jgi:hypothetical protein
MASWRLSKMALAGAAASQLYQLSIWDQLANVSS